VFAKRINFGIVHSVKNRVITIVAKAIDGLPPADADPVDKALYQLKSPDFFRRSEAARRLKEMRPDERREEVARALVALLNDDNAFTRESAAEALCVWGTKESVPALLRALNHKHSRRAVICALGRLKDNRAIEPLAEFLNDSFERSAVVAAL